MIRYLFVLFLATTQINAQTDSLTGSVSVPETVQIDTIHQVAYAKECALATSNSAKKWCSEVTLYRILVQNYPYPEIKDSTTFENREVYTLSFTVNNMGRVTEAKLEGGSNKKVNNAILGTLRASNVPFMAAEIKKGETGPFKYKMKLRAFDFMSPAKGPDYLPQEPMEINDQDLEGYEKGTLLGGYRISE